MRPAAPFGQYVPLESPVHRTDARVKLALVFGFTVTIFSVDGGLGLAVALLAVAALTTLSRVPPRLVVRGLRAVSVILAFTVLANALRWQPATVALIRIGPLAVDGEGLRRGLFFAARIVALVAGTSLLTLTTSPVRLADALEGLMRPFERFGLPAGDIAMMLTVAMRFIPVTSEEAERIIVAQTARGARFGEGGPVRRAKAYLPVLVPMFVSLFRRADELAVAMESRCYRGGRGRTRLRESVMRTADWVVLATGTAACAALAIAL